MNPTICPLTAKLFILRKICRKTTQMHNEMQSKQALCQCENRRSSLAENDSSLSKMFLLVSNISFMGVIIVFHYHPESTKVIYSCPKNYLFSNAVTFRHLKCPNMFWGRCLCGPISLFHTWFPLTILKNRSCVNPNLHMTPIIWY